jgi:HD superfamily phosphohydrolase
MTAFVPEIHAPTGSIRIPELRQIHTTERLLAVIDHPAFQRLRRVRQLGPIHLVYPGAVHSRFEHSLGVYDMARSYLVALLRDESVRERLTATDIEVCLLGALLHDLGHYPFAHSLEALHHPGRDTPRHEDLLGRILRGEFEFLRGEKPLADVIADQFGFDAQQVIDLVGRKPHWHARPERRLVATIISSGIDADKADYLERDSVHMGVSYGRNYDRARLLDSLCVHPDGDRIAISDKGRVSAEIFIFCRYTMFSEAYWHHTVRAVSAMTERAFNDWNEENSMGLQEFTSLLLQCSDDELFDHVRRSTSPDRLSHRLLADVLQRRFYRRVLTLNRAWDDVRHQDAYERIYHLTREHADQLRDALCATLSRMLGIPVDSHSVMIDTPPRDKDRIETVDVVHHTSAGATATPLPQISRVVQGIATDFIKVVKKIRIFVSHDIRAAIEAGPGRASVADALLETVLAFEPGPTRQQKLF